MCGRLSVSPSKVASCPFPPKLLDCSITRHGEVFHQIIQLHHLTLSLGAAPRYLPKLFHEQLRFVAISPACSLTLSTVNLPCTAFAPSPRRASRLRPCLMPLARPLPSFHEFTERLASGEKDKLNHQIQLPLPLLPPGSSSTSAGRFVSSQSSRIAS